jgi:hypothetical protein
MLTHDALHPGEPLYLRSAVYVMFDRYPLSGLIGVAHLT